jgi:hypothetical protein
MFPNIPPDINTPEGFEAHMADVRALATSRPRNIFHPNPGVYAEMSPPTTTPTSGIPPYVGRPASRTTYRTGIPMDTGTNPSASSFAPLPSTYTTMPAEPNSMTLEARLRAREHAVRPHFSSNPSSIFGPLNLTQHSAAGPPAATDYKIQTINAQEKAIASNEKLIRAKDEIIKCKDDTIRQLHERVDSLEEENAGLRDELEAAEKRGDV